MLQPYFNFMNLCKTMKKLVFALFVFSFSLFTQSYCNAQADSGKKVSGYLTIGYGASLPVGSYSSVSNNSSSGYAQVGGATNLSFGIIINSLHFGFAFMRGTAVNGFNSGEYVNGLQANNSNATYTDQSSKPFYEAYYTFYGLYKAFYYNNFSFDVCAMIGPCYAYTPGLQYIAVTQG